MTDIAEAIQLCDEQGDLIARAQEENCQILVWSRWSSRAADSMGGCLVWAFIPEAERWIVVQLIGSPEGGRWDWSELDVLGRPPSRAVFDHPPSSREIRALADQLNLWDPQFKSGCGVNSAAWRQLTGEEPPEFAEETSFECFKYEWMRKMVEHYRHLRRQDAQRRMNSIDFLGSDGTEADSKPPSHQ